MLISIGVFPCSLLRWKLYWWALQQTSIYLVCRIWWTTCNGKTWGPEAIPSVHISMMPSWSSVTGITCHTLRPLHCTHPLMFQVCCTTPLLSLFCHIFRATSRRNISTSWLATSTKQRQRRRKSDRLTKPPWDTLHGSLSTSSVSSASLRPHSASRPCNQQTLSAQCSVKLVQTNHGLWPDGVSTDNISYSTHNYVTDAHFHPCMIVEQAHLKQLPVSPPRPMWLQIFNTSWLNLW